MESPPKKQKTKHYFQKNHSRRACIEPKMKGFLVTTNFRPSDSVRDIYKLLNEYSDKMDCVSIEDPEGASSSDEEDISKQLAAQIEKSKMENKAKTFKFQSVDTGSHNCIFIRTNLDNHRELGIEIIKDTFETKVKRSKNLLRFLPIEVVTKSYVKDIVDACGPLFDKYFLKEPTEFSIVFNKRYNNDINRDEVIKELASLISLKNKDNKVNLKFPKLSVVVEVIKGNCCLAILPNFQEWRKYNLAELCATKEENTPEAETETKAATEKAEGKPEEEPKILESAGDN